MRNANWHRSLAAAMALAAGAAAPAQAQDVPLSLRQRALQVFVQPLSSVPLPDPGAQYLADREAARALGKALFWDAQLGSDGQACASCHFHAGADSRSKNQINPGFRNAGVPGGDNVWGNSSITGAPTPRFGPNYQLTAADFPLHKLANDLDPRSAVLSDTNDVVSSQGVFAALFDGVGVPTDHGKVGDPAVAGLASVFTLPGGELVRSVAPRNTPSAVNAVYNRRNFWDSRARDEFNGVNPIGSLDRTALVVNVPVDAKGVPQAPQFMPISIPGSSAASQAVGPPLSDVEMSYHGRNFAQLGRKMLSPDLHALSQQLVAPDDSVLGPYSAQRIAPGVTGLTVAYVDLVARAFPQQWWYAPGWKVDVTTGQPKLVKTDAQAPGLFSVIEYNFPLFFGLAVAEYEKTLRADDTPFDRFLKGDASALGPKELIGLDVFMTRGRCKECHGGPLFSNASIAAQDTAPLQSDQLLPPHNIERMINGSPCSPEQQATATCPVDVDPVISVYDAGFYNVGVRPTSEDLGIGDVIGPDALPLSHSQRYEDCVTATVAKLMTGTVVYGLDEAIRIANDSQHCAVPHIAARPIEAATVLMKAWSLATLNGLPPATSAQIGNLIGEAQALVAGNAPNAAAYSLASCSLGPACPSGSPGLLFQARDLLQANLSTINDPAILARLQKLLPAATSLLPDTVNPGPNPLEAYGPPMRPGERCNVRGAFKVPGLRNVALTAPYFHNGGQATLAQVVQFYDRGGDFTDANMADLAPNVAKIALLPYEEEGLLAFLDALTDERTRFERAPFDHPSLSIPNGGTVGVSTLLGTFALLDDRFELPAVGAAGHPIPLGSPGTPLANFPDPVWSRIAVAGGAGQQAAPGAALADRLAVQVLDADGNPVAGVLVPVNAPPAASGSPAPVTTGADGRAEAVATLGPAAGTQAFKAEAYAVVGSPVSLQVTAVAPQDPAAGGGVSPPVRTASTGGCATGEGADLSALLLVAAAGLVARRRRALASAARRCARAAALAAVAVVLGCGGSGGGGGGGGAAAPDAARSTLAVAPVAVVADGVTTAAVSVVARDAQGRALAGQRVTLTASGTGNVLSATSVTTGADGSASATIASTDVGAKTVTAVVGSVALKPAPVEFVPWAGCRLCGTGCFDLQTDAAHCGGCGHACGQNEVCSGGTCGAVSCSTLRLPDAVPAALVGMKPAAIAAADFDGDGVLDLVVANQQDNTVSVLFGAGNGTYTTPLSIAVGTSPGSITAGDLDGDGCPDIAVANQGDGTVDVLFNSFSPGTRTCLANFNAGPGSRKTFAVGAGPTFVAVAQLTHGPLPDLVVANGGADSVTILHNAGAGARSFTADTIANVGAQPVAIAVADLDGDGQPDLAVANRVDDTVSFVLQGQPGTFALAPGAPLSLNRNPTDNDDPFSIAAADLDGDGRADLAVVVNPPRVAGRQPALRVLLHAQAAGVEFVAQPDVAVGSDPVSVIAADLDGDGRSELVVANGSDDTVSVLVNHGAVGATSYTAESYTAGFVPFALVAADLDGDGTKDLAVASFGGNAVTVLTGVGHAVFAAPATWAARPTYLPGTGWDAVATGDLDGDGKPEVVVANSADGTVAVLRNRGDGHLIAPASYPTGPAGAKPAALAIADLDGDGVPDLAVADAGGAVSVLPGRGGATFAAAVGHAGAPAGSKVVALAAADLDGDGHLDLVLVSQRVGTAGFDGVTVLLNQGGGAFAPPVTYATGTPPTSVAVADFDRDGLPDIATLESGPGKVTVLMNNHDGTFPVQQSVTVTNALTRNLVAVVAADLNHDGKPDLAVADNGGAAVSVFLNTATGVAFKQVSFAAPTVHPAAVSPVFLAAADLDLDGAMDLVVASGPLASAGQAGGGYRAVTVLRNEGRGTFFERAYDHLLVTPLAVATADLDGNGRADVVLLGAEGLVPLFSSCAP